MSKTKAAWVIMHDHIEEEGMVNIVGPHNADKKHLDDQIKADKTIHFRMYDDDGLMYYEGEMTKECFEHRPEAPLEDYGTPNAGAVRLDVKTDTKGWEVLIA